MSLFCPKCWAKAKCVDSRCDSRSNSVKRRHHCTEPTCLHRFTTVELIVGEVDLRRGNGSSMMKLMWDIFDKLGGLDADKAFFEDWQRRRIESLENWKKRREKREARSNRPSSDHPWRNTFKPLH